jgi:hypothetical protein
MWTETYVLGFQRQTASIVEAFATFTQTLQLPSSGRISVEGTRAGNEWQVTCVECFTNLLANTTLLVEEFESLQHSKRLIYRNRICSLTSHYENQRTEIKTSHRFWGSVFPADQLWTCLVDDTRSCVSSSPSLERERQYIAMYRLHAPWGKREFLKGYYRLLHPRWEGGCSYRTLPHSSHHGYISTHAPEK